MINFEDIQKKYEEAQCLPFCSKLPHFKEDGPLIVFDENKSVKWNKEELLRKNDLFDKDNKRVKKDRFDAIYEAEKKIWEYISQETGLSEEKARKLWCYVYEKYHAYSSDLWDVLDDQIDLYNDLKGQKF